MVATCFMVFSLSGSVSQWRTARCNGDDRWGRLAKRFRVTAALRPDVIVPATDDDGHTVFRLKLLAEANDIAAPTSHRAMADVSTTLALCRLIKNRAPELWSQFLRFSQKAAVETFVADEDAFVVSETIGNRHSTRIVT